MSTEPVALTIEEVAALLRVGPKAVRRLIRLKRLVAVQVTRRSVRIHRSAVEQFLLNQKPS
ncbi:MAG TPA: helix-turn-helix domain-containing protein [Vicinamibacterales bacterium]